MNNYQQNKGNCFCNYDQFDTGSMCQDCSVFCLTCEEEGIFKCNFYNLDFYLLIAAIWAVILLILLVICYLCIRDKKIKRNKKNKKEIKNKKNKKEIQPPISSN